MAYDDHSIETQSAIGLETLGGATVSTATSKDLRKRAVSIRLTGGDLGKVKRLAARLKVRESDIIRFAVKSMLARLAPMHDPQVQGRNLLPIFVESGDELMRYFDLDVQRIQNMINEGASEDAVVEYEDIQLIAMNVSRRPLVRYKLAELNRINGAEAPTGAVRGSSIKDGTDPEYARVTALQKYLYEKYLIRRPDAA
jgi:hypothetical protein